MTPAAAVKGSKRRRQALLAGVALALLAYVMLRGRGGGGGGGEAVPLVPVAGAGGEAIDPGGAFGGGGSADLTSLTALLESRLAGLETTTQSLADRIDATVAPVAPYPAAQVVQTPGGTVVIPAYADAIVIPNPAPAVAPTVQGPSGQQPATAPGNAKAVVNAGTVKYYTYKKDVPLAAGQTLHFTTGKGYYAASPGSPAPAATAPKPAPKQTPLAGATIAGSAGAGAGVVPTVATPNKRGSVEG